MTILLSEVLGEQELILPFIGSADVSWVFFFLLLFYNFLRTHPKPVFISCQIPSERFGFCFERLPFTLIFQPGSLNYAGRINSDQEIERRKSLSCSWWKFLGFYLFLVSVSTSVLSCPYMSVKTSSPLHWSRTKLEDLYYKVRRTVKLEHLKQYDTGTKIGFIDNRTESGNWRFDILSPNDEKHGMQWKIKWCSVALTSL